MISRSKIRYILNSKQLNHIEKKEMQQAVKDLTEEIEELTAEIQNKSHITITPMNSQKCDGCGDIDDVFEIRLQYEEIPLSGEYKWERGKKHMLCKRCIASMMPRILDMVRLVDDVERKTQERAK